MPRDAAILYPKRTKSPRLDYQCVVRLSGSGLYYWIALWFSVLAPSPVGGIRFTPWNRAHPFSGQQPAPGLEPVTAKIALPLGGTHLEGRTERAQIEIWPRLARSKSVFELILSPAKMEGGNPCA
jgi:hypothetical protein